MFKDLIRQKEHMVLPDLAQDLAQVCPMPVLMPAAAKLTSLQLLASLQATTWSQETWFTQHDKQCGNNTTWQWLHHVAEMVSQITQTCTL